MKKQFTVNYEVFDSWKELPIQEQQLIQAAYGIATEAYAPYSEFHVGAVVELADGTVVRGSNQENIAYPSGICAERVALFFTGANYPNATINRLVVVATGDLIEPDQCVSPCGACRQVIAESEKRQLTPIELILVAQNERTWKFSSANDLLIFPFGIKE
jgi:cytidine deaminase